MRFAVLGFATLLVCSVAIAKSGKSKGAPAEVEIYAQLSGKVTAQEYVLIASKEPCDNQGPWTLFGSSRSKKLGQAFVEVFVPQGTLIHVCAAGLNAKKEVTAWGAYTKNPVKGEGRGEVVFSDLQIELQPLAAPRSAPAGI